MVLIIRMMMHVCFFQPGRKYFFFLFCDNTPSFLKEKLHRQAGWGIESFIGEYNC